MSQKNVERVIGLLVTDEAMRRRFSRDPQGFLESLTERGLELNPCERHALASIDIQRLTGFADALDPRLQKIDCGGCGDAETPGSAAALADAPTRGKREVLES